VITLINKSDLPQKFSPREPDFYLKSKKILKVSAKTREGLEALEEAVRELIASSNPENEGEQIVRVRHKHSLERALQALANAERSFVEQQPLEVVILDVKAALDEMRELIGEVYSEDLLDVIFSEFCIGK
jgi:tRNA modification GTPase